MRQINKTSAFFLESATHSRKIVEAFIYLTFTLECLMIRLSFVMTLALLTACTAFAVEDKIDGKLLIGKWEPEKAPPGLKVSMEFTKDNKVKFDVDFQGKKEKVEGTYKLENNQFSMTLSKDGQERTQKGTIARLNDKELVLKDDAGKEEVLKRLP